MAVYDGCREHDMVHDTPRSHYNKWLAKQHKEMFVERQDRQFCRVFVRQVRQDGQSDITMADP